MRWQEGQQWETPQSKWNSVRRARWASIRLPESIFTGEMSLFLYQCALQQSMHLHYIQTSGMFVRQCMELPSNVHLQHVYIHHLQKYLNEELSGSPLHVVETSKQLQREWPERRSVLSAGLKQVDDNKKKTNHKTKLDSLKGYFTKCVQDLAVIRGWETFVCIEIKTHTHTQNHITIPSRVGLHAAAGEPTGKRGSNCEKFINGLSVQTVLAWFAELCGNMFPVKIEED